MTRTQLFVARAASYYRGITACLFVQAITGQFVADFTLAVGRFFGVWVRRVIPRACGWQCMRSAPPRSSARPTDLVRSTPSPIPPGLAVPRAPLVFNSSGPLARPGRSGDFPHRKSVIHLTKSLRRRVAGEPQWGDIASASPPVWRVRLIHHCCLIIRLASEFRHHEWHRYSDISASWATCCL